MQDINTVDKTMAQEEKIVVLRDGRRARLHPVNERLLADAASSVRKPQPPIVKLEGGREAVNENDPVYVAAMEEYEAKQAAATIDAAILFGIELVDGLPDNDDWLRKLMLLRDIGHISFDDPGDDDVLKTFLYLKYVAGGMDIAEKVLEISTVRESDIQEEEAKFPAN